MSKKFGIAILLVLTTVIFACCKAEPKKEMPKLIIGCGNSKPYNYIDDNGDIAGIDIELAREACRRMGYKPVFRQIAADDWENCLESGHIDSLWGASKVSDGDGYSWIGPYMYGRIVVAVSEDSDIKTIDDLENKTVSVLSSSKAENVFLGNGAVQIPKLKSLYCLTNISDVAISLRNNYVDACAGYAASLTDALQNANISYKLLENDVSREGLGVILSERKEHELRQKLTETLKLMRDDGTERRILELYGLDAEKSMGGDVQ